MIFELAKDFAAVLDAMPPDHPRRRILKLLDEAIRRDVHFINRHPTTLFQCMWNTCWWYDCPEAAKHYEEPEGGWKQPPPWKRECSKLHRLLEDWRNEKEQKSPGFRWLRPPPVHLGTAQEAVLRGHKSFVTSVAFSPDGRRIASASNDKSVRVWDVESGEQLTVCHGHDGCVGIVNFSLDGSLLLTVGMSRYGHTGDKTIRIWDAETGTELECFRVDGQSVFRIAHSRDWQRFVSAQFDRTLRVYNGQRGSELAVLRGHRELTDEIAISIDGSRIATGARDNTVRVWDAESGGELACLKVKGANVTSVAFSPDGTRIAGASGLQDPTVRVWDAASGAELACLKGHEDRVDSVAFSPDGRRIASGSGERDRSVRLWDAESGAELFCLNGHEKSVMSVVFSPDGGRIASGSSDGTVRIWDVRTMPELRRIRGHKDWVNCIAFSPLKGRLIVTGARDNSVRLWDAESGAELALFQGHADSVNCVAFSADEQRIASGSNDKSVRVWSTQNESELAKLHGGGEVISVAFSLDGRQIASGSQDEKLWLWDPETSAGRCLVELFSGLVNSIAFSTDGRRIVAGCQHYNNAKLAWDNISVRVWDAVTGADIACMRGHEAEVTSMAFSPDGRRIVSASLDQTVRVWNAGSAECLEVIEGFGDVAAIAAGKRAFPFRALPRVLETIVDEVDTARPQAFFPSSLRRICTHPSGRRWAGAVSNYLSLIQLEEAPGEQWETFNGHR